MDGAELLVFDEIRDQNQFESQSDKLARKLKESPFFGIGLLAMTGVCAVGAYRFRRPLTMSTPQYLMQLRVAAQGACVGSVVVGAAYTMATQHHSNGED
ncbi:HIG1 domain family member 1A, mitochondrial-like isoform X2 [Macrosteles quadrilineatus]|uniref:HIG1 domain family member 1A, mitochondrial-like isoform X2 n=1 Tax=Macrosteles quadrilineatus TaxID=74068 RepID=UPI0023E1BACF|nr:HIG1 domain family member 1A, mitochondrial-like isoform X2 [Macrosteles quadrilineatus]